MKTYGANMLYAMIHIPIDGLRLVGELSVPNHAIGVIIMPSSGSADLLSHDVEMIVRGFHRQRLATLTINLLGDLEIKDYGNVFDITLLSERLSIVTDWVEHYPATEQLPIGLYTSGTNSAAAVMIAGGDERVIKAIVCNGGRIDLAKSFIAKLKVPTLLIVGKTDHALHAANEDAFLLMSCRKELAELPLQRYFRDGNSNVNRVITLASEWFKRNLQVKHYVYPRH